MSARRGDGIREERRVPEYLRERLCPGSLMVVALCFGPAETGILDCCWASVFFCG